MTSAQRPERRHRVELHGVPIGVLSQYGDFTVFSFDDDYWDRPDRSVLGLQFENRQSPKQSSSLRVPSWFSNLLPEGRLREWIALDRGVPSVREMELLAQVGHDLPGAVTIVADTGRKHATEAPGHERSETAKSDQPDRIRFSLAGVGLKFSMLRAGDRLSLPGAGGHGDVIVKLPDASHAEVPRNEYAMMSWAAKIGIDVPAVALVRRDDLPELPQVAWPNTEDVAYVVDRFDRSGPSRTPVHIEDLAQVRGFYPEQKYEGSFETIAGLVYRNRDVVSLREFVRRLTFNLIIGNGDAHLKNWSLIYPDGRHPILSPTYDVVSTAPYRDAKDPEDLGLKFGGSKRFGVISRHDFVRLEKKFDLDGELLPVVEQTIEAAADTWEATSDLLDRLPAVRTWIDASLVNLKKRLLLPR